MDLWNILFIFILYSDIRLFLEDWGELNSPLQQDKKYDSQCMMAVQTYVRYDDQYCKYLRYFELCIYNTEQAGN